MTDRVKTKNIKAQVRMEEDNIRGVKQGNSDKKEDEGEKKKI